ncbi:MAG: 3D domain-containing protein [Planctomycetota bacterium]|nr:3D domain-containing protein [Planctomycetota bacterium]
MRYWLPGYARRSGRQVGGLHRYLRPLGSTWLIVALAVLVLAAGWVLHGKAQATLSTAQQTQPAPAAAPSSDVDQLLRASTPAPALALAPAGPAEPAARKMWVQVTAYCPCARCCGPWAYRLPRRFADGTLVADTDFALAADVDVFPFGTQIRVPGYAGGEPVPVLDVGRAVSGTHIEIFLHGDNAHRRAKQWGSRWMEIEVLDK